MQTQLQKQQQQQIAVATRNLFTTQLVDSIVKENKIAVAQSVSEIMPGGNPDFSIIRYAPSIAQLLKHHGYQKMITILCLIIKDMCDSANLPENKNMNQNQVIECASFLLDECDNYRLEDYVMMFTLAKRGKLSYDGNKGRIFDRIDIQLISEFKTSYEHMRRIYGEEQQVIESKQREQSTIVDPRDNPNEPDEVKQARFDKILPMFNEMRKKAEEKRQQTKVVSAEEIKNRKLKGLESMLSIAKETNDEISIKYYTDQIALLNKEG